MASLPGTRSGEAFVDRFASALLDPGRPVPVDLQRTDGRPAERRFAVYRNNVTVGLVDALVDIFPATCAIVGEEFFRAMARMHVAAKPPRSKLMFEYGREFPDFIETFEPARTLPYLADIARLERAWLDAYHAADALPFDLAALAAIVPEQLGELRLAPHPAFALVSSRYAIVDIFRANRGGEGTSDRIDGSRPQIAIVTRPHLTVAVAEIGPGEAAFAEGLAAGETLGAAIELANDTDTQLDLPTMLTRTIGTGAFVVI